MVLEEQWAGNTLNFDLFDKFHSMFPVEKEFILGTKKLKEKNQNDQNTSDMWIHTYREEGALAFSKD